MPLKQQYGTYDVDLGELWESILSVIRILFEMTLPRGSRCAALMDIAFTPKRTKEGGGETSFLNTLSTDP